MNSNITNIITFNYHKMLFQNFKIPGCYLKFLGRTLIWFGCIVALYIHVHWYFYWEYENMFIFFLLPQNICQLIFLTYSFVYIFIIYKSHFPSIPSIIFYCLLLHFLFHVFMWNFLRNNVIIMFIILYIVYCMYMEKSILSWKTCVWSFCHYLDNKICLNWNHKITKCAAQQKYK
jgi:hypothetical protein